MSNETYGTGDGDEPPGPGNPDEDPTDHPSGSDGDRRAIEATGIDSKKKKGEKSKEWFSDRFLTDDELNDLMREIGIDIDGLPVDDHGNAQRLLRMSEGKLLLLSSGQDVLEWAAYAEPTDANRPTKWTTALGKSHAGAAVIKIGNVLLKWAEDLRVALGLTAAKMLALKTQLSTEGDANKRKLLEKQIADVEFTFLRMVLAHRKVSGAGERLRNNSGVNAIHGMAANVPEFILPAAAFDRDFDRVVAANCVIDLRTGAQLDFGPEHRLTRSLACAYEPSGTAPRFMQFLREVFLDLNAEPDQELIDFAQEVGGLFLTGHVREQKSFTFYGATNSGKSTLLDLYRLVLGETQDEGYAASAPYGLLRESSRSWHSTAALRSVRLVVDSEFDQDDTLNIDSLKRATGERYLPSDGKYAKAGEFVNSAKIAAVTNFLPTNAKTDEATIDEAVLRRFVIIPMNAKIVRKDLKLADALAAERVGVLAWMVEGAQRWYQRGRLVLPQAVLDAQRDFREALGMALPPVEQAFKDASYVWPDPEVFTPTTTLVAAVNAQRAKSKLPALPTKEVTGWCNKQDGLRKDRTRIDGQGNPVAGYWGIGL